MKVKLTPAQGAVLLCLNYGIFASPDSLPQIATSDLYGEDLTVEETQLALQQCLNWGWARLIDEPGIARIADELRTQKIFGPIYGMPHVGCVDFTTAGAEAWLARQADEHPDPEPFAYTVVVCEKTTAWEEHHYCDSEQGFEEIWRERREQGTVFLSSRIVPIGPWCVYWWKRFLSGYRLELELCGNRY